MQGLFDPDKHEPLQAPPWSEDAARAALQDITARTLAAFTPVGLWPPHARDDHEGAAAPLVHLYGGAAGVVWALRQLAAEGVMAEPLPFDATVAALVPCEPASYFLGCTGVWWLQWQVKPSAELADRLFDAVQANLDHASREFLWGNPGTVIAAIHMAEATFEARWRKLVQQAVQRLADTLETDPETGTPIWTQDMYGRHARWLGAGHGLAGNVYAALRASEMLDAGLVQQLAGAALATLQATALHADGGANWHPMSDRQRVAGRLPPVQDCHGAPGIINRLAGAPRSAAWDALLQAAGELTWAAGPLRKGPGLCHGTAGSALAMLKLHLRFGHGPWLQRGRALALHAATQVGRLRAQHGQGWHGLWTGDLGVAWVLHEAIVQRARLPLLDRL